MRENTTSKGRNAAALSPPLSERISFLTVGLYSRLVYILFFAALVWLVLLAGFGTVIIQTPSEENWFTSDSMVLNLALALGTAAAVWALLRLPPLLRVLRTRINETGGRLFLWIRRFILLVIFAEALFLVLSLRVIPEADQSMVLLCAETLNNGDNTYLQLGQYLQGRQNQFGIVFLLQIYIRVFGADNYAALQIFNAFGLAVIWYELSEIGGFLGLRRFGQLTVAAFGVVFLPLALYTTFFYGTIPGLAFSLAAIRRVLRMDHDTAQKIHRGDPVLCAVYIVFACVLKSNYIIFLVGIVIYALIAFLRRRRPAQLGLVGLIVVLYLGQSAALTAHFNSYLAEPMEDGLSGWSYVAMGLQECSYATDGWYNGYNTHSFEDAGYDAAVQAEMSKASIAERVQYFLGNPVYALRFFAAKVASEWNDPLFQGEWIVATRESEIETAAWTDVFSDALQRDELVKVFNAVQFLVLFGALLQVIPGQGGRRRAGRPPEAEDAAGREQLREEADHAALLLEMIFFGGFLFHVVWEAKAQYTLPYFMLLVPLAARGYQRLCAVFGRCAEWVRVRRGSAAAGAGESVLSESAVSTRGADQSVSAEWAAEGEDASSGAERSAFFEKVLSRRSTVLAGLFLALCLVFGISDGVIAVNCVKLTDTENTYEEYLASYGQEDGTESEGQQ